MSSPYVNATKVKKGQIYRAKSAKTRGGFRYVQIQRVYHSALALATATCREVSKSGKDLHPDHIGPTGEEIATSFDSCLDTDDTMHTAYEYVRG